MDDIAFSIMVIGLLLIDEIDDYIRFKLGYTKEEIKKLNNETRKGFFFVILSLGLVIYLT